MESRPRMVEQAKKLIEATGFKACTAHCAIEAKPPVEWNKGSASIYILRTAFGLDWSERIRIIYAGDDVTDEDAMKVRIFFISARAIISQSIENNIHYRSVIIIRILIYFCIDFERYGCNFPRNVIAHYPHVCGETSAQHGFSAHHAKVGREAPQ